MIELFTRVCLFIGIAFWLLAAWMMLLRRQ